MSAPAPIQGTSVDKVVVSNFKLEFDGGDTQSVVSVTGILKEMRYAEVRQGGSQTPTFSPTDSAISEVTITFTMTSLINSFQAWAELASAGANAANRKRNVTVIPLQADGVTELPAMARLVNCNPRSYAPGDFDATTQEALVGTLVVQPEDVQYLTNQAV